MTTPPEIAAFATLAASNDEALRKLGRACVDAARAVQQSDEIRQSLATWANYIDATEALAVFATEQHKKMREYLVSIMADTGCMEVPTASARWALEDEPRRLIVTDEAAIPPEYFITKQALDRTLLLRARKHKHIPGTELSNSGARLVRHSRKEAA